MCIKFKPTDTYSFAFMSYAFSIEMKDVLHVDGHFHQQHVEAPVVAYFKFDPLINAVVVSATRIKLSTTNLPLARSRAQKGLEVRMHLHGTG